MLRSLSIAATRTSLSSHFSHAASPCRLAQAKSSRLAIHSKSTRHVTSTTRPSTTPTTSAQARHETLTSTLAKPPGVAASSSSNTNASTTDHAVAAALQKQRIQHGALQSALAFVTVLISAQSLKNAQENRKLERERDALLELVADKNQVLQALVNDEAAFRRVARKCLSVLPLESNHDDSRQQQRRRPWFLWRSWSGRGDIDSHDDANDDDESNTMDRLVEILRSDLVARVGKAGLTREQQDQLQLQELLVASQQQQQSPSMANMPNKQQQQQSTATAVIDAETDALLEQLLKEESTESGEARKRTVYAF